MKAPIERCFDLSRSIDLHMLSTQRTNEKAIAGRTSGLICLNETVTWKAKHFGISQTLTTKITQMKSPDYFVDEMMQGTFKSIFHHHQFEAKSNGTLMIDRFNYEVPLGIMGRLFDKLILKRYMKGFLLERNELIKSVAEGDKWKDFLSHSKV
ncbi:MAG: SRPBCC family protein [Bacteroidetes bacterium]|nr:SRPBCC family protein [Bacteroidota bacterium]